VETVGADWRLSRDFLEWWQIGRVYDIMGKKTAK
jgi:hypothetical protein